MSPIRRDAEVRAIADARWEGITERLIREAQERGEFENLPLHGKVDSLNVSVSSGILLYEALRQRTVVGSPSPPERRGPKKEERP